MENLLEVENLTVEFQSRKLLTAVNLHLNSGEHVALVGPNGSGKTTLLRCLFGAIRPQMGSVKLAGKDFKNISQASIAKEILYIPNQLRYVPNFTVNEYYLACLANRNNTSTQTFFSENSKKLVQNLLEKQNMSSFATRMLPSLSTGELRKVLVLTALLINTKVVLLDEPTSALDPANTQAIQLLLKQIGTESKRCILQVTHNLHDDLGYVERIISLKDGQLIEEGAPSTFLTPANLLRIYGVEYNCHSIPGQLLPVVLAKSGGTL